jgi:hypothetical protein
VISGRANGSFFFGWPNEGMATLKVRAIVNILKAKSVHGFIRMSCFGFDRSNLGTPFVISRRTPKGNEFSF